MVGDTIRGLWRPKPGGLTPEQNNPPSRLPERHTGSRTRTNATVTQPFPIGGFNEQGPIQENRNRIAPQVPGGRRSGHRGGGDAGIPDDRQGPDRADQHALAVHLTGGELKIEVLPAGAVVPAFGLLDAVSKGTLDGGHGVLVYHYGKQNALDLWGSGPAFG